LSDSKERIAATLAEVEAIEEDVAKLTRSRHEIEQSEDYKTYALLESEAREMEKDKAEFRDYVSDLFSHLNRAFTKYSYGVSKSVAAKIDRLSSSPWEIFLNQQEIDLGLYSESSNGNMERNKEDRERIEAYRTLLVEIRGAVTKGTISLKDSEKVSTYLDRAIDTFPKIESRGWEIQKKAISIKQNQNRKAFNSIKSLDEQIRRNKSDIAEKKILIEETQNSIEEKRKEIQYLTDECNNLLTEIIGQEKIITTTKY
jgi:flagellar biosynthesis chaperone FliJ